MSLKEWHDRATQNWSRYMDRLEASVTTPSSIAPAFLKSSKPADARAGLYTIGNATGIFTMAAVTAAMGGQLVLSVLLAVAGSAPGLYHAHRGKKILEQRAAANASLPSADIS